MADLVKLAQQIIDKTAESLELTPIERAEAVPEPKKINIASGEDAYADMEN